MLRTGHKARNDWDDKFLAGTDNSPRSQNSVCAGIVALSFAFGSSFILERNQLGIAAQTALQPKLSLLPVGAAVRDGTAVGAEMEKVAGIGGLFFRAHDPKALAGWYQQHLGISLTPSSYEDSVWQQEAGSTLFAPFEETSDYFGDAHKLGW